MTLKLGPDLQLPDDLATESVGILGQRGSGKSNALVVYAEELTRVGIPWFAVDPKGDWWGIRSSEDGKGPGLSVPIFGGLHGDLPLGQGAGVYLADLLVDEMLTAVLDTSGMTQGALSTFLVAFCHRIFQRHQQDPHVRVAIFEEAHRYIPQMVTGPAAALKEATAKIPLEGRAFGLGSATASQRSSRLHKDVLTQFSVMFAMRSPAKLDRDAIGGWVEEHDVEKDLLRTLSSLENGEAWLWSPHALGRAERVTFRRRWTFDSGATPKVGRRAVTARTLADVDLAAIKEAMADTIERVKADDPKELRRRIAQLEAQVVDVERQVDNAEGIGYERGYVDGIAEAKPGVDVQMVQAAVTRVYQELFDEAVERLDAALLAVSIDQPAKVSGAHRPDEAGKAAGEPRRDRGRTGPTVGGGGGGNAAAPTTELPKGERACLTVIAQHGEVMRDQLSILTGYKRSTRDTYIQRLRERGYVLVWEGGTITATQAGLAALGDYEPLPVGAALRQHWLDKLPSGESLVLRHLMEAYPRGMTRDDLSAATGFARSTRDTYLQRLRTRRLVDDNGCPRAADVLFDR